MLKFLARFVAHYESCVQDVENVALVIRVCCCSFWDRERKKKLYCRTLYFSPITVKSLQLRGHRQITEPRKYCLVRVIVFFFFGVCFLYFCFSQVGNFRLIPYKYRYWNPCLDVDMALEKHQFRKNVAI